MPDFAETRKAFESHYLPLANLAGEHHTGQMRYSMESAAADYREYDHTVHLPEHVDPFAFPTLMTDIDHVRVIDEVRLLHLNMLVDKTLRADPSDITRRKLQAAGSLASLIESAVLNAGGINHLYVARSAEGPYAGNHRQSDEDLVVEDPRAFIRRSKDVADEGLTVIISDFQRIRFAKNSLRKVLAIKLNDLSERQVLRGESAVSLGEEYELHRSDPRQTMTFEQFIQEHHSKTVQGLKKAGAEVVSVVADRTSEGGYNIPKTDREIALALSQIAAKA